MHGNGQRNSLEPIQAVTGRGGLLPAGPAGTETRRAVRGRDARGQGLVEFSLTLVFLTVLLMGLLDLSRAYFTYLALKDAAAEGAYYGSAFPQCKDNNGIDGESLACAEPNTIPFRVTNSAPRGGLVDWNDAAALVVTDLPCNAASCLAAGLPCTAATCLKAGQVLTVTVSYGYHLLTPFAGIFANGQTLTLTARTTAVIVRVPDCRVAPCK